MDYDKIFEQNYKMLNAEQKEAVDSIDGPVLVIAGPGTGKTQLLSVRIANILRQTDTQPSNILAMTFTDAGAENMRERLTRFIGPEAYKVNIFTYHAFANEIIQNYREFFIGRNLENPIDPIRKHQILSELHEKLPHDSLLKKTTLGNLSSAIADFKRSLVSPENLQKIAQQNVELDQLLLSKMKNMHFENFGGNAGLAKKEPIYLEILGALAETLQSAEQIANVKPNLFFAFENLQNALEEAREIGKASPLTSWKNNFFSKFDKDKIPQSKDVVANKQMLDFANFYADYSARVQAEGFYDYDDMILEVISALENNPDLRFELQEKYQYILLDEYQDTNQSQSRIIELLTENPLNEGRPNVLAVGDDDQAIYAFQGASSSNMIDFFRRYRETKVVNLTKNYRSQPEILETAKNIAEQISDRLTQNLPINIEKNISAEGKFSKPTSIIRQNFKSEPAEYAWVADEIQRLIAAGISPQEIAVLAPKHKFLERFSPYLKHREVPISYEKRENILDEPTVRKLIQIAKLTLAIAEKSDEINELLPEVLSFDFWQIPASEIWKLSWKSHDERADFWIENMLASKNPELHAAGEFLTEFSAIQKDKSLEEALDILLGTDVISAQNGNENHQLKSPIRKFIQRNDEIFYDTLSNLTVLRDHLRDFSKTATNTLRDLIEFEKTYREAELQIVNTNPHSTSDKAAQLMTPYSAKGLEFSHVFLLSTNNNIWNSTAGGQQKLALPKNLEFSRIKDESENTRKRLFFVAITRAKTNLYLTNFAKSFNGKNQTALEFLSESDGEAKSLPEKFAQIIIDENEKLEEQDLATNWHEFYAPKNEKLRDLLRARLAKYQISPTHVNSFVNVEYSNGPKDFYENNILQFPQRYSVSPALGNLIHEALKDLQDAKNQNQPLTKEQVISKISSKIHDLGFSKIEKAEISARAEKIINNVFENEEKFFESGNIAEKNFRNAGVILGNAHLTGKIDLIKIDQNSKEITVVDYKTGSIPFKKNKLSEIDTSSSKIHRYEQQLYFYKILIESSPEFAGYKVKRGVLEFIEPKDDEKMMSYEIEFSPEKESYVKLLIQAIFERIKNFNFEIDEKIPPSYSGIRQFENQIIEDFARQNQLSEIYINRLGALKKGETRIEHIKFN
ncbi:MAG: ATP-dependent DNA helicase [bacterium]|nr:ATP-dependent DNA helicase [bacterium]